MSKPKVSIIVPTYNDEKRLRNLLQSLDRLEFEDAFEVIVVDDASIDNTSNLSYEWSKNWHPYTFHYLRLKENKGPGIARNAGLERAEGVYVAFTDSDCRVHPLWLKNLISAIKPEEKIVGCGGKVKAVSESSVYARLFLFHKVLEPPEQLHYLVTCNCCFLKEPLCDVGGFEGDIRNPGGEDIAACIKLWKKGWRFGYQKDAIVYHDFDSNFRSFIRTWYNYGYGCSLVLHKYLQMNEIYPSPGEKISDENYWPGYLMTPPTTGIRSGFRDLKYQLKKCRDNNLSLANTIEIILLTTFQRISHLYGWQTAKKKLEKNNL
ncbi:MAG: glycosyltransferase [Candidatus Hydrogenedentes bacterium]|nr:glycosyltransferase [Candidatus Hydrogenedentota bacterium]